MKDKLLGLARTILGLRRKLPGLLRWLWGSARETWYHSTPYLVGFVGAILFAVSESGRLPDNEKPIQIVASVVLFWGISLAYTQGKARARSEYLDRLTRFILTDGEASLSVRLSVDDDVDAPPKGKIRVSQVLVEDERG